jgi:hypothetical protein
VPCDSLAVLLCLTCWLYSAVCLAGGAATHLTALVTWLAVLEQRMRRRESRDSCWQYCWEAAREGLAVLPSGEDGIEEDVLEARGLLLLLLLVVVVEEPPSAPERVFDSSVSCKQAQGAALVARSDLGRGRLVKGVRVGCGACEPCAWVLQGRMSWVGCQYCRASSAAGFMWDMEIDYTAPQGWQR